MAAGDVISGSEMTVHYGAIPAEANHVGAWSINVSRDIGTFASNSTAGWQKTVAGTKRWTGSMKVFIHDGAALEWSIEGAVVNCEFHPDGNDTDHLDGEIRLGEISHEYDADSSDPVAVNITFTGHGALTSTGTLLDV